MLNKTQRLLTRQLEEVIKKGGTAHSPLFLLRYLPGQKDTRIAVSLSKKIGKTAVMRVNSRRRMYAAVRPLFPSIVKGVHIVIFAKQEVGTIKVVDLTEEMRGLLMKTRLIR